MVRSYSAKMSCHFDLYAYPFDVQTCSVRIQLPPEYEDSVHFSLTQGTVNYTGSRDLATYDVERVRFSSSSNEYQLIVEFALRRRQGVVLLSTFLPSALLLAVSWATLFVKLEALNVRAVMALTTLLVLYTLFANMSSSLPPAASIKLIDIWFFFIIFLLFANIMIHIFIDHDSLTHFPVRKIMVKTSQETPGLAGTKASLQQRAIRFLAVYRLVVLPGAVLVFNGVFWAAVLWNL
ncbi:gamma-aminobutyric acid receptor subunit delta-like [Penaeus japonicus]|uniref:gamma-aminobutyric acid receptor subunit delta-like n=1 Tax=Penaeus japonicus TaxID=27405 RepID=UPI001C70AFE9|nr:gamma-aminobutyric acid receptor subunit delta-like [Penaeus japonicus]